MVWQFIRRFARPSADTGKLPRRYDLVYHGEGGDVRAGRLTYGRGTWTFAYDDEYKHSNGLTPLDGFDDMDRVYRSQSLFPFFSVRLPDPRRPDVARKLEDDGYEEPDALYLLATFGRRSVSSPAFELVPVANETDDKDRSRNRMGPQELASGQVK